MRKSKRAIQIAALILALACSMSKVNATVTYQIGSGGLETFNMSLDGGSISGLAGGISIHRTAGDSTMPLDYITVCTDLGATLYLGQSYTYDSPATSFNGQSGINPKWGTGTAATEADAIQNAAYLFNTYYNALTAGGLGGIYSSQSLTTQRAALQLAVWDVLYDTTGVGAGSVAGTRFSVTGGDATAISDALSWVSALDLLPSAGNFGYAGFLLVPDPLLGGINKNANGESPQELLIQSVPVPESTTIIAGALLLLPLGASTFRILSNRRAA
jgi:hypothetical protein